MPTQHWHEPVEQLAFPRTHFLHVVTSHEPPPDDPEDPDDPEEPEDDPLQLPAWHVWPVSVQSVHGPPPVPQTLSDPDV